MRSIVFGVTGQPSVYSTVTFKIFLPFDCSFIPPHIEIPLDPLHIKSINAPLQLRRKRIAPRFRRAGEAAVSCKPLLAGVCELSYVLIRLLEFFYLIAFLSRSPRQALERRNFTIEDAPRRYAA